jgi:hypothetical protein
MAQVRPAAGLQVDSSDFNCSEHTLSINLFTNTLPGEFLRSAVPYRNFAILKNDGIGRSRRAFENQRSGLWSSQIDGADSFSQVKRNGNESKTLLKNGGQQMLASMLLHVIETAGPMDAAFNSAFWHGAVNHVNDAVFVFLNIEHIRVAQFAKVIRLSARGGIQQGLIKNDCPTRTKAVVLSLGHRNTTQHLGGETI